MPSCETEVFSVPNTSPCPFPSWKLCVGFCVCVCDNLPHCCFRFVLFCNQDFPLADVGSEGKTPFRPPNPTFLPTPWTCHMTCPCRSFDLSWKVGNRDQSRNGLLKAFLCLPYLHLHSPAPSPQQKTPRLSQKLQAGWGNKTDDCLPHVMVGESSPGILWGWAQTWKGLKVKTSSATWYGKLDIILQVNELQESEAKTRSPAFLLGLREPAQEVGGTVSCWSQAEVTTG